MQQLEVSHISPEQRNCASVWKLGRVANLEEIARVSADPETWTGCKMGYIRVGEASERQKTILDFSKHRPDVGLIQALNGILLALQSNSYQIGLIYLSCE